MVGRVYRGEIYYIHETEGTGSEQTRRKTWNNHQ